MEYRRLGKTGLSVSRLCLGCMSYGEPGWEVHPWVLGREESMSHYRRAAEAGINFLDCSNYYSYGVSEEMLGDAVREYFNRHQTVIATKLCFPMGKGPNESGLSRKHIVEQVDASLKRMKVDHIDLLYTHRFDPNTEMEEMMLALDHVVRQGKALYLGACSAWAWEFAKVREQQRANGLAQFSVMQNFYNLAYREEEREMIPYCASEGVGLVPWSPIARGFLAGNRPKDGVATDRAKSDKPSQSFFGTEADYAILERVQKVAADLGVKPAQIAYAWVLAKPDITSPILGATKLYQLDEAIAALDIKLDEETIAALEEPYQPRAILGHS